MKIAYYSYDHVGNPYCGGGGAYRDLMIHTLLASRHSIRCYYGNFRGARPTVDGDQRIFFLGSSLNYLISRITYSICATFHCLFVRADVIVICYSIFSPVLAFILRRKKTVLELFHLARNEPFRKYSLFGALPVFFEHYALLFGKNILCINRVMAEYIAEKYRNKNIATVYTGFDNRLLSEKQLDDNYILSMGRIDVHMKGLDLLIDAFEKIVSSFPHVRLIIAGRGSQHDCAWVRNRIRRSSVAANMLFKENVSDAEKTELFHKATFVCIPSRFEGWCIAAIEAAASSKATIGTRITGLMESICENETGIIVPAENVIDLAGAMARLLNDAVLRNRLGMNGYKWAQNFSWETIALAQEQFYRSAIK
jgi:glycosyltransferase involved in cell wall biosynthesis